MAGYTSLYFLWSDRILKEEELAILKYVMTKGVEGGIGRIDTSCNFSILDDGHTNQCHRKIASISREMPFRGAGCLNFITS